jgi:hypothetical protein
LSDFVRRAVKAELARLSFLSEIEKKSLGVEVEVPRRNGTGLRRKQEVSH